MNIGKTKEEVEFFWGVCYGYPMGKTLLTALAALLLALPARAEYRVSTEWQAPAHLEGGGSLAVSEAAAEFLPTWSPSPESRAEFGLGAGFQYTVLDLSETRLPDYRLHTFRIPLQATVATTSRVRILARLAPALHSDLKDVDDQDFHLGGFVLAFYPWKPRLQVGAGAALTDWAGFYGLIPVAGLRWQATDRLDLDLFMPRPRLIYKPSDRWSVYAGAAPSGGQWNIGRGVPGDPQRDLHLKGFQALAGAAWRPRAGVELSLTAGGLFARSLKIDGPRDTEFRETLDLENAPFVALAVQVKKPGRPPR